MFSFFTIQANILSMIVSALLARAPNRDSTVWRILCQSALIGITITGIVYSTVLARVHEPKGWGQVSTNTVFHYIVPIMMVIGWLVFGPRPRMNRSVVLSALIWPVLWLGYTLAHGAVSTWYPYPFVDAHHAQSMATGAKIVFPPADQPYGQREYAVSDTEGRIWSFATRT